MSDGTEPTSDGGALGERQATALDALVEAGFDPSRVPDGHRAEAERIAWLLRPLDRAPSVEPDESLVDVTLARVFRATGRLGYEPRLVPDDEEALDAWVNSGYDASRVPGGLRERARRHEALAGMVSGGSRVADGDVVSRTLAGVQAAIDREEASLAFEPAAETRGGGGLRHALMQAGSIAAMLLLAASVIWPVLGYGRSMAQQAACQANMSAAAFGLSMYAGAHRDALPMVTASLGDGAWWDVTPDQPRANSANLFHLARAGFVPLADLACPGNPSAPTHIVDGTAHDWRSLEEISYSYQIMFGRNRPAWAQPDAIILTDRSPVVIRSTQVRQINPLENSPNHQHGGQHALRADGSALWLDSPILGDRDNIWLPRSVEDAIDRALAERRLPPLRGTELPDSAADTFVGP